MVCVKGLSEPGGLGKQLSSVWCGAGARLRCGGNMCVQNCYYLLCDYFKIDVTPGKVQLVKSILTSRCMAICFWGQERGQTAGRE